MRKHDITILIYTYFLQERLFHCLNFHYPKVWLIKLVNWCQINSRKKSLVRPVNIGKNYALKKYDQFSVFSKNSSNILFDDFLKRITGLFPSNFLAGKFNFVPLSLLQPKESFGGNCDDQRWSHYGRYGSYFSNDWNQMC